MGQRRARSYLFSVVAPSRFGSLSGRQKRSRDLRLFLEKEISIKVQLDSTPARMQKDGDQTGKLRGTTKEKVWSKASAKKKGVFRKLQLAGIETVASNLSDK
jgi:hypothetical protein